MLDAVANFAFGLVTVAPSPALSGTAFSLATADANLFPDPTTQAYNVVVFPSNQAPSVSNAEIVRVTAKASPSGGNVQFTIVRTQESTSARTITIGDRVMLVPTAKTILDIDTQISALITGWISYSTVVPTRASADDPTYVLTFSGVDLTGIIGVGDRIKWTQNSTVRYAIVTAIAFSTNTTLTIYGGTDYDVDDTGTNAISNFHYSHQKRPVGFPISKSKWRVLITDTANRDNSTSAANTYYNIGTTNSEITFPIGEWEASYQVVLKTTSSTAADLYVTLSTANNSESDAQLTSYAHEQHANAAVYFSRKKLITVASKTKYYLNAKTSQGDSPTLSYLNGASNLMLEAVCAYL